MIKIEFSFESYQAAQAAIEAVAKLQSENWPKIEPQPEQPKAEAPGKSASPAAPRARSPRTAEAAPTPAAVAPGQSGEPSAPKAEATKPTAAATSAPSEEDVSREIRRFIPDPAHKARAVALLKKFGVAAGRELKPDQRAPFLAELAAVAKEVGL